MSALDEIEALRKQREEMTKANEEKEEDTQIDTTVEEQPAMTGEITEPTDNQEVMLPNKAVQEGIAKAINDKVEQGGEIKDLAKDLTYLAGASNLQRNDDFKEAYEQALGKQLIEDLKDEGKRQAIANAAKKQETKNIRAQSFYNGCKPIFELLGIEEAYGLVSMIITVILLMIPFLVVSLIRFVFNSINSIATAVAGFRKPAFWLYRDWETDRKSTRLNSSHSAKSRMPSSA